MRSIQMRAIRMGSRLVKPIASILTSTTLLKKVNGPLTGLLATLLVPPKDINIKKEEIENVTCEIASPFNSTKKDIRLVYFHGGGFHFGSPRGHRNLTSRLAIGLGAKVYSVKYTLGSHGPAEEEAEIVVKTLLNRYPKATWLVAGDSAGGNLSIHVGHVFGDKFKAVIGISPWVDLGHQKEYNSDPLISTRVNKWSCKNVSRRKTT